MPNSDARLKAQELAEQFRSAIEASLEENAFKGMRRLPLISYFPRGCCELSSKLLQHYLKQHGIEAFLVYGDCRDERCQCTQSHVWLELSDKTVIDITGDQFKGRDDSLHNDSRVYCDQRNAFYSQFKIDLEYSYKPIRPLDEKEESMYNVIINYLLPAEEL